MAMTLYPADLVDIVSADGGALGLALVDAVETVEGRQVGAWVYPVRGGRVDRRLRYYYPRRRIHWTGLCTIPRPPRWLRILAGLAEAMGRAQLPDAPDWGAAAIQDEDPDPP